MAVLVTGGAGYIGSHICVELLKSGHKVVVYDNFQNSRIGVIDRIRRITGTSPEVVKGDVRDLGSLTAAMTAHGVSSVIHLAGLKSVAHSVTQASDYYDTNVVGTLRVVQAMQQRGIRKLVFSSSATVYGEPQSLPLDESHRLAPFSPYGRTKLHCELMLNDIVNSSCPLDVAILRYFNPVGAHESGLIGEDPNETPNNLMPYVSQVAVGRLPVLNVFGNDYPTPDGTGVRDYVHVVDLAEGHVAALSRLQPGAALTVNLGTGRGTTVLQLVEAFASASGKNVPTAISPRRAGDVAAYYASSERALDLLGWRARRDIDDMCRDTWNWQRQNPNGYQDS